MFSPGRAIAARMSAIGAECQQVNIVGGRIGPQAQFDTASTQAYTVVSQAASGGAQGDHLAVQEVDTSDNVASGVANNSGATYTAIGDNL